MNSIDKAFQDWMESKDLGEDAGKILTEAMQASRYSIEVNYRTTVREAIDGFAKLTIGYISAGMKNCGYHTKIMLTDKPYRVMVSTRNWDDGEWVGLAVFDHDKNCFSIARGTYNKDRKTVSIHSSKRCDAKSAAEVVREMRNLMEELKRTPTMGSKLEPADLKRGPKPTYMQKLNKASGPFMPKIKKAF